MEELSLNSLRWIPTPPERKDIFSMIPKQTACEMKVARPAPLTPIPSPKMKTGSRTMFSRAPESMPTIAREAFP